MPVTTAISPTVTAALKEYSRSQWALETYDNRLPGPEDSMLVRRSIGVGTRHPEATDHQARQAAYATPADLAERLEAAADAKTKVTVLRSAETYLGSPFADIRQGTLFHGGRGLAMLPKGSRTKGFVLGPVIDIIESSSMSARDELATRWVTGTGVPLTTSLSAEKLASASRTNPLAVLWTHPGFGEGSTPGCVWLIDHVEEDVANGFLWCPPSTLESEHGSIYVKDLLPAGALSTVAPLVGPRDGYDLPVSTREAYTQIFGL